MSAIVAGVLSQTAVTDTTLSLASTAATGATGNVTQQLYVSQTPGFTPGVGNIVAGATALSNTVTGKIPNTPYYAKMTYTDDSDNTTVSSNQVALLTAPMSLDVNSFDMTALIGAVDLKLGTNTISAVVDPTQADVPLFAGMAIKFVDPVVSPGAGVNSIPSVVGITANDDQIDGFINYSLKDQSFAGRSGSGFLPGAKLEISRTSNVLYLMATANGSRGEAAVIDISTGGGVKPATGSTGNRIVGEFIDIPAIGKICRVQVLTGPSAGLDT